MVKKREIDKNSVGYKIYRRPQRFEHERQAARRENES